MPYMINNYEKKRKNLKTFQIRKSIFFKLAALMK